VNGDQAGYVIIFQSTETIQFLVKKLNFHFILAGLASLVSLCIVYLMLSRWLTRPLIRMKEATEKLSKGDFNVELPPQGKDELGDLSNAIQKLASDLERVKRDRIEFLASISHELRTPLTYLSCYSKVAMRSELNEDERQKYLSIIDEEAIRMTEMVKNLFDLTKVDETSFTVSKQTFQAIPFFSQLYERMLPSFNLKSIHLELKCAEEFEIHADPIRLEQIVMNLLDKALKYSNEKIKHLHGLGYPNGEDKLVIATHNGLYEYDNKWKEATSRKCDYMGFSAVKDGFYSSGHPEPKSDYKDPFGLIKSKVDGESFTQLGSFGETNFHFMTVGYESNVIYVINEINGELTTGLHYSDDDGKTWTKQETKNFNSKSISNLSAHLLESSTLAIGSQDGLFISRDFGESFNLLGDPTKITYVSLTKTGGVYASIESESLKLASFNLQNSKQQDINLPVINFNNPIAQIAVNPTDEKEITIATSENDIYQTQDFGETWQIIAEKGILQV